MSYVLWEMRAYGNTVVHCIVDDSTGMIYRMRYIDPWDDEWTIPAADLSLNQTFGNGKWKRAQLGVFDAEDI